ncbi:hypothetical protein HDU85_003993 [Gaertneriomyces sp. JEL0708]|nr:hypothetical protein HDU85_003993 [Gaertneriomyces sp. JEL0708]
MGDTESYISLMSMAIQSALALRYDIDPDVVEVHGQLGWLEKESRRRLWWMLCLFDRQPKPGLQNPVMYPMIHNAAHPSVEQYTFGNMSRVKVPAPEALWQSVRDVHGLPAYESFLPDYDVDCVALAGRLTEVFFKIQRLPDHATSDVSHVSNASDSPILAALSKFEGFAPAGYNAPIPGEPTSSETETLLAVELQAIIGALPDWARDLTPYSDFSTELVSRNPPPVQLLIQHIVYHCLMICLRLNIVLTGVDALKHRAIGVHDNVTPMQHEAYTFCRHHAGRVADLLRKLLAYNPTGRWVDWFSLYLVFRSALVLIVALKAERDREGLIQAHQDLEVHLDLIRAVGRHLWFGHYMTKIYEDIILNS